MIDVFQALWSSWSDRHHSITDKDELDWLFQLNTTVFAQLEEKLSPAKISTVDAPMFFFCARSLDSTQDVPNLEVQRGVVVTQRILLDGDTLGAQAGSALVGLSEVVRLSRARTVFFYTPIFPLGNVLVDGTCNRRHMAVRFALSEFEAVGVWRGSCMNCGANYKSMLEYERMKDPVHVGTNPNKKEQINGIS